MKKRRKKPLGLIQHLYITWDAFNANDLFTYASAGAYSFLLSALPIMLMVLAILIRVLNASPDLIIDLLGGQTILNGAIDLSRFIDSIMSVRSVGLFEIILGVSIFWMARSFFASIQKDMTIIYRKRGKGKLVKENLVVIAGEVVLIFLIVIMAAFLLMRNTIFTTFISESRISPLMIGFLKYVFRFSPFGVFFIFLFLVYYFTPRTKPKASLSLVTAAGCTISFILVLFVLSSFVNMAKYNLVYGILSNLIVILFDVYVFFILFLFFAEFQYVAQFFDSFLLGELYLLPKYDDPNPVKQFERMMFIEPPLFYEKYAIHKHAGETIFELGDSSTELYYIWQGSVRLSTINQVMDLSRGTVFGEFSSIIGGNRTATATVLTNTILLKIPDHIFQETIEVDAKMSRKTLQMISDYVRKNNQTPLSHET